MLKFNCANQSDPVSSTHSLATCLSWHFSFKYKWVVHLVGSIIAKQLLLGLCYLKVVDPNPIRAIVLCPRANISRHNSQSQHSIQGPNRKSVLGLFICYETDTVTVGCQCSYNSVKTLQKIIEKALYKCKIYWIIIIVIHASGIAIYHCILWSWLSYTCINFPYPCRNYMEHVCGIPDVSEWTREEELIYQAEQVRKELEAMRAAAASPAPVSRPSSAKSKSGKRSASPKKSRSKSPKG